MIIRNDADGMALAIRLSRRGFPAPNPHVGCVLVQGTEVVGMGWHEAAGRPHAEANALRAAGLRARGATAYVTLEPCNHFGRTPPCAQALIQAGVRRVVVAVRDPNPRAAGGIEALQDRGIEVVVGEREGEARDTNRFFLYAMQTGRPYVVAKAAVGLDGRMALANGQSQWITGETARRAGHRLRAQCGAVLVGAGTVAADNPALTARLPGVVNPPLRVVWDPRRRLTGRERVFDSTAPTLHITEEMPIAELLDRIREAGAIAVLVEGGPTTLHAFLRADMVNEIRLFVAPKLMGNGPAWFVDAGDRDVNAPLAWEFGPIRAHGPDREMEVRRRPQLPS